MSVESEVVTDKRVTQGGDAAKIAYLDQALWKKFQQASDVKSMAEAWLILQCTMIVGVTRGSVILKNENDFTPVAYWPQSTRIPKELYACAELAIREAKGVVKKGVPNDATDEAPFHLAHPVELEGEVQAVVSIELTHQSEVQLRAVMRQLQWGAAWFEVVHRRLMPETLRLRHVRLTTALKLVATCLEHRRFVSAATAVATELATHLGCERVSLGFLQGQHIRVKAVSHTANFDKRTNMVRAMGVAMDEAMDQRAVIVFPRGHESQLRVTRAQEELLKTSGTSSVCSVPLSDGNKIIGGMTIEHKQSNFFSEDNIALCEKVGALLGPLLDTQCRDSRWIGKKIAHAGVDLLKRLLGAGYVASKLTALIMVGLITFLSLATGQYRISSDATLEGWIQRHVSSPIDGYIDTSYARAGDIVNKGQLLFKLENKELGLEKEKWLNQTRQLTKRYRDAFVQHDKAQVGILKAQLEQARSQLQLVQERLSRTTAVASMDGILVAGDLSQKLGAPVEKGESLFKIAPLDAYRVILAVEERNITHIKEGQTGQLSLFALPEDTFVFTVVKVTPVAEAEEGRNLFKVEARLQETYDKLRPGMQGAGKIEVDQRKLLWIWTHGLVDWFRLWAWSWWP